MKDVRFVVGDRFAMAGNLPSCIVFLLAWRVELVFVQNGKSIVRSGGSFSPLDRGEFLDKEARLARLTTDRICGRLKKQLLVQSAAA